MTVKLKVKVLVAGFALGLIACGWLRTQSDAAGIVGVLSGLATPLYVGLAVAAAFAFINAGVPVRRVGFFMTSGPIKILSLAVLGVGLLQLSSLFLGPLWEGFFGAGRDLTRFNNVSGSVPALVTTLALSWTLAAFGEELTFRILLMRGIAFALGDSRVAFALALLLQAMIFGIVHAYQGPAGIAGTMISGLIFGGLTLAARGSIWPAALAHGFNNSIGLLQLYAGGAT